MSKTKLSQKHKRQRTINDIKIRNTTKIKDVARIAKGSLSDRKTAIYFLDNSVTTLRARYTGESIFPPSFGQNFNKRRRASIHFQISKALLRKRYAKKNKNTEFSKYWE